MKRPVHAPAVALAAAALFLPTRAVAGDPYAGDGTLSGRLEATRWLLNRARYAPEKEADRLGLVNASPGGHPDYDCCEDAQGTNDFGLTTAEWTAWRTSKPPLAPNARLAAAAAKHCLDMAETGLIQHTSPSSNYYPLGSAPWDRMTREGYAWRSAGENITAGTDWWLTPECAHSNLFADAGVANRSHRKLMLDFACDFREIGLGYATDGTWGHYTQDFARSGSVHFVTDTLFRDANADRAYNDGEGVGGIEVRLLNGLAESASYDVSGASGSFAVPAADLPDGARVTVVLVNASGADRTITIPLGFTAVGDLTLTNRERRVLGAYTQPAGAANVGFRNVDIAFSATAMAWAEQGVAVTFASMPRAEYCVEWTSNVVSGTWRPVSNVTASADAHTVLDRDATNAVRRFYRVSLRRDP